MRHWKSIVLAVVLVATSVLSTQAQVHDDDDDSPDVYFPNATEAWFTGATKLDILSLPDEPMIMAFYVYGFETEDEAADALEDLFEAQLNEPSNNSECGDYEEISVGQLGKERKALYRRGSDCVLVLNTYVRVGVYVQRVQAMALGGDLPAYMSEYLEGILDTDVDDGLSLVPELSDLPVGWSLIVDEPFDDLDNVQEEPGD